MIRQKTVIQTPSGKALSRKLLHYYTATLNAQKKRLQVQDFNTSTYKLWQLLALPFWPHLPVSQNDASSGNPETATPGQRHCTRHSVRQTRDPLRPAPNLATGTVLSSPESFCRLPLQIDQSSYIPGWHGGQERKRLAARVGYNRRPPHAINIDMSTSATFGGLIASFSYFSE